MRFILQDIVELIRRNLMSGQVTKIPRVEVQLPDDQVYALHRTTLCVLLSDLHVAKLLQRLHQRLRSLLAEALGLQRRE